MNDMKVRKIEDDRLKAYINRTRSGSTQVFYTGNDERDWERYRAEGGARLPNVEMHDKPDTIRIEPPERHYYAQLLDGEWWWVNGCAECNGRPRDWMTYIECDKHNVCRTCGTPRAELTETPYGGKHGWQCKPCERVEREALKRQRLEEVSASEYDELDYKHNDNVKCPHCGTTWQPGDPDVGGEHECNVCDGKYEVEVEYSVTYSTSVVGERITYKEAS